MTRVVSNKKDIKWIYSQMVSAEVKSSPTYVNGWWLSLVLNPVICGHWIPKLYNLSNIDMTRVVSNKMLHKVSLLPNGFCWS